MIVEGELVRNGNIVLDFSGFFSLVSPSDDCDTSLVKAISEKKEIIIYGRRNMNRAFDGDIVAVELLSRDQWQDEKALSIAEEDEEEDNIVHLAPNSADDAPRTSDLAQETSGDTNANPAHPSGRVVGVIRKSWHSYSGSLEPMSLPAGSGGMAHALLISKDCRIPKIRINTRQLENLLDMRIVVAVDSWDRQSRYP